MAQQHIRCITSGRKIRPKTLWPYFPICSGKLPQEAVGNDGASLVPPISTPLNHFLYGPNDITLDLSGFTIAQAAEALADIMNFNPLTVAAYVDGKRVRDWKKFVLHGGAVVEFMKEWGFKGSGREEVVPKRRTYRGGLPDADARGYIRPEVGRHRFNLGHESKISKVEALRRLEAIRNLFNRQCEVHEIDFWSDLVLPWAKRIAAGQPLTFNFSPYAHANHGQAAEEVVMIESLRNLGINVISDDIEAITAGEVRLKEMIAKEVRRSVTEAVEEVKRRYDLPAQLQQRISIAVPADPAKVETRTFRQAIKAYREFVEKTGKRQDNGHLCRSVQQYLKWTQRLEQVHEDFALWELDRNKLEELNAYWRNRPVSKQTGKPISWDYASHILDGLWAVLYWLDESNWLWEFPKGAKRIDRTPVRLDSDRLKRRTRRVSGSTYTPEQLAVIAAELNSLGKLIVGISVNCAMQPAEVGRLEKLDFYTSHPETGEQGDWIIFDRPKTHEYGEWILWPEVAELVRWGIERADQLAADRLITTSDGIPWYREDWAKPEARFGKWWQAKPTKQSRHIGVVTRLARDREGFPRHTIKTLRKILPNLVRPKYGKEVADLVNARRVDDSGRIEGRETDRYADRLYGKVYEAILELEDEFRPFLDALKT